MFNEIEKERKFKIMLFFRVTFSSCQLIKIVLHNIVMPLTNIFSSNKLKLFTTLYRQGNILICTLY